MSYLRTQSNRIAQRVTIVIYLSAIGLTASCDATNQDAPEIGALEPPIKSRLQRFVPQEVLIKFKNGVSPERIAVILKNNQISVIAEINRGYLYHVRIMDNRSVESAITQLTSYQEVEYAEPNYRYGTQK